MQPHESVARLADSPKPVLFRPTRRSLLAVVLSGAGGIIAAACGPAGGSGSGSSSGDAATLQNGQPVKVTFFSPASDPQGEEIMKDQTRQFNDSRKDVQIDYVYTATDDNYKQFTTAMVAGSAPDVMMTYDYPPVPQWQAKGLIRDLEQYRKEMGIKPDDYFANVWQMITFGGKLYGFLQEFDANLLVMDVETVTRAGLDPNNPPKTIDELDNWNARVVKKTGEIPDIVGIAPWRHGGYDLWAGLFGGGWYDPATQKFTINRKENVAALAWMNKTAKLYGGYDTVEAIHKAQSLTGRPSLYAGRTPLSAQGEWNPQNNFRKEQPDWKFAIGYFPIVPGVTYGTGQTGGGNVFVMPKDAPHPKEAAQVMKYFGGAEQVYDWNVRENNLPPVKALASDPKFRDRVPLMTKWLDMLKIDKMKPVIAHPLVAYFGTKRSELAAKAITGELAPQQALDELQKHMDEQVRLFEQTKSLPS